PGLLHTRGDGAVGQGVRRRARAARLEVRSRIGSPRALTRRCDRGRAQFNSKRKYPFDGACRMDRTVHAPALRRPVSAGRRPRNEDAELGRGRGAASRNEVTMDYEGKVAVVTGGATPSAE